MKVNHLHCMSTLRKYSHPCLQCDLSLYMFCWCDSWLFRHFARFTHQDFPSYAHKDKHVDTFLPSTHKPATAQICLWRFIGLERVTLTGNKFVRMQLKEEKWPSDKRSAFKNQKKVEWHFSHFLVPPLTVPALCGVTIHTWITTLSHLLNSTYGCVIPVKALINFQGCCGLRCLMTSYQLSPHIRISYLISCFIWVPLFSFLFLQLFLPSHRPICSSLKRSLCFYALPFLSVLIVGTLTLCVYVRGRFLLH